MYSILEIESSEIEESCEKYKKEGYGRLKVKDLRSLSGIISDLEKEFLSSNILKMVISFTNTNFIKDENKFVEFLGDLNDILVDLSKNYGWTIVVLVSKEDKFRKYIKSFVN